MHVSDAKALTPEAAAFYVHALKALETAGVPHLVGDARRAPHERSVVRCRLGVLAAFAVAFVTLGCSAARPAVDASPSLIPTGHLRPAPLGCRHDDVRSPIEAFFAAFDRGDKAALGAGLSKAFVGYAIGSPEPRSVIGREEAIDYFAERSRLGERMALATIAVTPYLADGNVGFELMVHRELRGRRLEHEGKGAIYCGDAADARGIVVLSFGHAQ